MDPSKKVCVRRDNSFELPLSDIPQRIAEKQQEESKGSPPKMKCFQTYKFKRTLHLPSDTLLLPECQDNASITANGPSPESFHAISPAPQGKQSFTFTNVTDQVMLPKLNSIQTKENIDSAQCVRQNMRLFPEDSFFEQSPFKSPNHDI